MSECTICIVESQFAYKIDEFRRKSAIKVMNRCRVTRTLEEIIELVKNEPKRRFTNNTMYKLIFFIYFIFIFNNSKITRQKTIIC